MQGASLILAAFALALAIGIGPGIGIGFGIWHKDPAPAPEQFILVLSATNGTMEVSSNGTVAMTLTDLDGFSNVLEVTDMPVRKAESISPLDLASLTSPTASKGDPLNGVLAFRKDGSTSTIPLALQQTTLNANGSLSILGAILDDSQAPGSLKSAVDAWIASGKKQEVLGSSLSFTEPFLFIDPSSGAERREERKEERKEEGDGGQETFNRVENDFGEIDASPDAEERQRLQEEADALERESNVEIERLDIDPFAEFEVDQEREFSDESLTNQLELLGIPREFAETLAGENPKTPKAGVIQSEFIDPLMRFNGATKIENWEGAGNSIIRIPVNSLPFELKNQVARSSRGEIHSVVCEIRADGYPVNIFTSTEREATYENAYRELPPTTPLDFDGMEREQKKMAFECLSDTTLDDMMSKWTAPAARFNPNYKFEDTGEKDSAGRSVSSVTVNVRAVDYGLPEIFGNVELKVKYAYGDARKPDFVDAQFIFKEEEVVENFDALNGEQKVEQLEQMLGVKVQDVAQLPNAKVEQTESGINTLQIPVDSLPEFWKNPLSQTTDRVSPTLEITDGELIIKLGGESGIQGVRVDDVFLVPESEKGLTQGQKKVIGGILAVVVIGTGTALTVIALKPQEETSPPPPPSPNPLTEG